MVSNVTNINEPSHLESGDNVENLDVKHRAAERAATVDPEAEVKDGIVKWCDTVKGYGFFVPSDNSGDVLLHKSYMNILVQMYCLVLKQVNFYIPKINIL